MMELKFAVIILSVFIHASVSSKADIRDCSKSPPYYPKTVVKTTDRLADLRDQMRKANLSAYIIPATDAHGSEYVRQRDKRREFISGFDGSAGTAVVTLDSAALWTDGRYFLQAEQQLDCNWILQKDREKGTPSQTEWLIKKLKSSDRVGIDPFLVSIDSWDKTAKPLKDANITFVGYPDNLVDEIWTKRPAEPNVTVIVQELKYTGKSWEDKVKDVQDEIKKVDATAHVVQELDSVAWLLNLRGNEIPYNPVFFAYVIVKTNEVLFFVNDSKISSSEVQKHLKLSSCSGKTYCIKRKLYGTIREELKNLSQESNAKIWLSPKDSHALKLAVNDENKQYLKWSPIRLMKGKKNKVELDGMRNANLKDSVALAEFFLYAEEQVAKKADVTELSLEKKMEEYRSKQALYKGLSFASIVGFGPNGAVIHYRASKETNAKVTDNSTLLVDTGSQYLDGSTDVTRTVHFGTPTPTQKSAFTRVLMGQIDLAMAVFPQGTYGRAVDILARQPLFRNGWNYRHGTGHGIGSFLYIHEGPGRIASGCPAAYEKPLEIGFVLSDEPGYYEDGNFGIRLETAVVVVNASTPNRFNDVDYYTFEPICYFPIQRKLIDETIMSDRQIKWLNDYHEKTAKLVGKELQNQKKTKQYNWLMKQTKPITNDIKSAATTAVHSISFLFIAAIFALWVH
ncbi:xaa-Pro aminopeptidase 1-like [Dendronephthya gigantea]|uniref:xaa-Pro aminopeptidase 1-like n=1 Tax=Dendronephthya gigantea TaxID=151771 RepID=UPI00106CCBA5|nr:xaa-Pro aminopeptidase 1-like [Dendronephthya gigantea]